MRSFVCIVFAICACTAIAAHAAPLAPDMTEAQWHAKCDVPKMSWLLEYIRWAKEQRSKGIPAAGVKYLVWSCELPPGKKLPWVFCHGLSDRLRGIMSVLRLAVTTNRLLLVRQNSPASLEEFLMPHLIDWSVQPSQLPALAERVMYTSNPKYCRGSTRTSEPYVWDHMACTLNAMIKDGSIHNRTDQFLFVEVNDAPSTPLPGLPDLMTTPMAQHCAFTALFAASPATIQAAARHMALLGLEADAGPFTALHLRLGGSLGEAVDLFHHKQPVSVHEVVDAVDCTKTLSQTYFDSLKPRQALNASKLVLVTDNIEVRKLVAEKRFMPELSTVPGTPVHWERYEARSLTPLLEVMADLVILARATCLVHSHSGFSRIAYLWSGTACNHEVQDCKQ